MEATLCLWGRPVNLVIQTRPVAAGSGHYTRVEVLLRGRPVVDNIPDMYPGDQLELTLRF